MNYRVLLIDDDLHVLRALLRNLRDEPYELHTATSAEEGLSLLRQHAIDLVVCDWKMPGMSGTEFLATVARQFPHTIRIMLTGHATLPMVMGAINQGAVHKFLTKPFEASELAAIIRAALRRDEV
jgi:DNA-binding NtrC family response regulator